MCRAYWGVLRRGDKRRFLSGRGGGIMLGLGGMKIAMCSLRELLLKLARNHSGLGIDVISTGRHHADANDFIRCSQLREIIRKYDLHSRLMLLKRRRCPRSLVNLHYRPKPNHPFLPSFFTSLPDAASGEPLIAGSATLGVRPG